MRCAPYGVAACVFNGCKRGHVYGDALARLVHALLSSICCSEWLAWKQVKQASDPRDTAAQSTALRGQLEEAAAQRKLDPDGKQRQGQAKAMPVPAWAAGLWQQHPSQGVLRVKGTSMFGVDRA